jgi:hypothetical protein
MNTNSPRLCLPAALNLMALTLLIGCNDPQPPKDNKAPTKSQVSNKKAETAEIAPPKNEPDPPKPLPGVKIGNNVHLQIDGDKRRVLVNAVVCLRMGMLEQLLCRMGTKEHESILAADIDARNVHTALLAAGAEAGSPVKFQPKYTPAHGTVIKVYLQYEDKGNTIKVPAQQWVRNIKTRKELAHEWVFAGSILFKNDKFDPDSQPFYAANSGDVICVANFDSAMLDLPILSSQDNDDLDFEAFTERIPPEGTNVVIILEPGAGAKGKK